MDSHEAEVLILASSTMVWNVLSDTGNYAVWNSGIVDVSGELRSGGRIRVRTRNGGKRNLRVKVQFVPGQLMTWSTGLPLELGNVVRTFILTDYTGITHLVGRDRASGLFRGLVMKNAAKTNQTLDALVDAVKFRAELLSFHLDVGVFPVPPTAD